MEMEEITLDRPTVEMEEMTVDRPAVDIEDITLETDGSGSSDSEPQGGSANTGEFYSKDLKLQTMPHVLYCRQCSGHCTDLPVGDISTSKNLARLSFICRNVKTRRFVCHTKWI